MRPSQTTVHGHIRRVQQVPRRRRVGGIALGLRRRPAAALGYPFLLPATSRHEEATRLKPWAVDDLDECRRVVDGEPLRCL
jgi:hypothetical protein